MSLSIEYMYIPKPPPDKKPKPSKIKGGKQIVL